MNEKLQTLNPWDYTSYYKYIYYSIYCKRCACACCLVPFKMSYSVFSYALRVNHFSGFLARRESQELSKVRFISIFDFGIVTHHCKSSQYLVPFRWLCTYLGVQRFVRKFTQESFLGVRINQHFSLVNTFKLLDITGTVNSQEATITPKSANTCAPKHSTQARRSYPFW